MKLKKNLIEILIFRQLPETNVIAKANAMAINNIPGKDKKQCNCTLTCQKSSPHSRLPVKAQITIKEIATRTRDTYAANESSQIRLVDKVKDIACMAAFENALITCHNVSINKLHCTCFW